MANQPRMLQLCAVDFTVANILLPLINACRAEYEVEIACAPGVHSQRLAAQGYRFHAIPFSRGLNPFAHLRALLHLIRLLRRQRYDIVHTHTPIAAVLARLAARLCGVPVVVNTVHGFYFHEHMRPAARRVAEAIERWMGKFTTFTFLVSQEDYAAALRLGICTPAASMAVGNGVDQARFDPARPDLAPKAAAFRREIGVAEGDLLIGIVCRMVREKGVGELLDAFAALQPDCPQAHLVLIGDALESDRDGIRARLAAAVAHPHYGARVHWVGYRSDVDVLLQALDVFALPSYREGLPISIIEAMSMGLPVVATDIRGCREEVVDGVTGLLVPHKQVAPLARALQRVVADADLRRQMGRAGLARARELYAEKQVLGRQLDVLRRLCTGRRLG